MLQHQHSQDDFCRRTQPPAGAALGVASDQGLIDDLHEVFIVQNLVHLASNLPTSQPTVRQEKRRRSPVDGGALESRPFLRVAGRGEEAARKESWLSSQIASRVFFTWRWFLSHNRT
jgi:hypothetical protein